MDEFDMETGVWEEAEMDGDIFYPVCSECGYMPSDYKTSKFCPHCGVKMCVEDENQPYLTINAMSNCW